MNANYDQIFISKTHQLKRLIFLKGSWNIYENRNMPGKEARLHYLTSVKLRQTIIK